MASEFLQQSQQTDGQETVNVMSRRGAHRLCCKNGRYVFGDGRLTSFLFLPEGLP
jgi:hypothetical protein